MAILQTIAAHEQQIKNAVGQLFGNINPSQIEVSLTSNGCTIQITSADGLSLTKFEYDHNSPQELTCTAQRAQIMQNYPVPSALSFAAMPVTITLTTLAQIRSLCHDLQEDKDEE